jgi:hypothetical protein
MTASSLRRSSQPISSSGRHHVRELALADIAPFAGAAERVVNHDIGPTGLIEASDQIGADKTGPAGDQ